MFKVALTEGWLDIMWWGNDNRGPERIAKLNTQIWPALLFSIFIHFDRFAFFAANGKE